MADKYVNGRRAALQALDTMLGEEKNIRRLGEALQIAFDENPVLFFDKRVIPLLPKEIEEPAKLPSSSLTINLVPAAPKE
jgi:hypothetical protein